MYEDSDKHKGNFLLTMKTGNFIYNKVTYFLSEKYNLHSSSPKEKTWDNPSCSGTEISVSFHRNSVPRRRTECWNKI